MLVRKQEVDYSKTQGRNGFLARLRAISFHSTGSWRAVVGDSVQVRLAPLFAQVVIDIPVCSAAEAE